MYALEYVLADTHTHTLTITLSDSHTHTYSHTHTRARARARARSTLTEGLNTLILMCNNLIVVTALQKNFAYSNSAILLSKSKGKRVLEIGCVYYNVGNMNKQSI